LNIYTLISDTHFKLFQEYFLPSLNSVEQDFNLIVRKCDQSPCPDGSFFSKGFAEITKEKVKLIIQGLSDNYLKYILFSDCDIIFNKPFLKEIKSIVEQNPDKDIFFSQDREENNKLCAGFMVIKSDFKNLCFFNKVLDLITDSANDQNVINCIRNEIDYFLFPYEIVNNYPNGIWRGEDFELIDSLIFHANYTVGVENKVNLLKYAIQKNTVRTE
jgi:hypothetical protein